MDRLKRDFSKEGTLWSVRLGIFDLAPIVFLLWCHGFLNVRYLKIDPVMSKALHILSYVVGSRLNREKIEYQLGDMRTADGASLRFWVESRASQWGMTVAKEIVEAWQNFSLPVWAKSDRARIYLERQGIWEGEKDLLMELVTVVALGQKKIKEEGSTGCHYFLCPDCLKCRSIEKEILETGFKVLISSSYIPTLLYYPRFCRRLYKILTISRLVEALSNRGRKECLKNNLAVQYVEGIDLSRRSELFWYPESGVGPEVIFFYFNFQSIVDSTQPLRDLEAMGIHTIVLNPESGPQAVPKTEINSWTPNPKWLPSIQLVNTLPGFIWFLIRSKDHFFPFLVWSARVWHDLSRKTLYWLRFITENHIALNLYADEGQESVAQHVAVDLCGGIQIGRQRSEIWRPPDNLLGFYHGHIHFVWGRHYIERLQQGHNGLSYCIITGFTYDHTFSEARNKGSEIRKIIVNSGAKLIICLYDAIVRDHMYSERMIRNIYTGFIEWVESDSTVGLIIKSKKPEILLGVPDISRRLQHLQDSTGRCILLDPKTQPATGAFASDFAVGLGISSAVTEAAIAGVRGIHCDLRSLRSHEYYKWGYGRVIFDDTKFMIDNLKSFKENPNNNPTLGDFNPIIDDLDPFRDGQAGYRAGQYMRGLQEGFNQGLHREDVMNRANDLYADAWGADKVIDMRKVEDSQAMDNSLYQSRKANP